MVKAVVYDCDGVIVDSREAILSYYNWMMGMCGLPHIDWSESEIRQKALSLADRDILEVLAGGNNELYQKMLNISRNQEKEPTFEDIALETGIKEGLEIISLKKLPMAVVTNRGKSLESLLEYFNIRHYFDITVTSRDVTLPKPSPEGLLKISDYFSIKPEEMLFIGDSPTDYHAAKSCGAKFISFKKTLWEAPVMVDHKDILNYL